MAKEKVGRAGVRCYPARSRLMSIIGIVLIALGVLLILICVPYWAWLALVGAALIVLGILMLRKQ